MKGNENTATRGLAGALALLALAALLILQGPLVTAWSNGSYAHTFPAYDWERDYSTHDWIAEGALDALSALNGSAWEWLELRIQIYLLGTEAPDNAGVNVSLDGERILGFGDVAWHHIYLEWDNGSVVEDDAALRAKAMGDLADARLAEGKLDQAAFYLGAMTHYIADVSMFSHCAENGVYPHYLDFDYENRGEGDEVYVHGLVEARVGTRTNDYRDREEFFRILGADPGAKSPYDAAVDLAWDTFRDPNGTRSAVWLRENYFSDWAQTRAAESDPGKEEYYARIEENLNEAIEACASALLYATGREGGGEGDGGDIPLELPEIPGAPLGLILLALLGAVALQLRRAAARRGD